MLTRLVLSLHLTWEIKMKIALIIMVGLLIISVGCSDWSQNNTPPVYSGPAVSGGLQSGWQKTTIQKIESLLGQQLPVPTYLPAGYEIREVYYCQEPNSSTQVTDIILLISEQQVGWVGEQHTCRIALSIGWNEAGLGLKMTWAEYIPAVQGRLEQKDNEYVLWWESYGSPRSLGSTLRLYASLQLAKDELIKVAGSTLANPSPSKSFCVRFSCV